MRARRRELSFRGLTDAHVFQLLIGVDFFGDGFGTDLDAMRSAWSDPSVRERVYRLMAERVAQGLGRPRSRPWAEQAFAHIDDLTPEKEETP